MAHQWRSREGREDGVAILMSLAVVMVVGILVVVIAATAIYETSASGRDRQRATTVSTAEGAVDTVMATIQTSTVANYPCPTSPTSTSVLGDELGVVVEVLYFDAAGDPMDCLTEVRAGDPVASAHIKATAEAQRINGQQVARRTIETQLNLIPQVTNLLDNAIHSDTSVKFTNKVDVYNGSEKPGDAANIYSRGDFECNNSGTYDGTIVAVGKVTLQNPCVVKGSIWAGGNVVLNNGPVVQGSIRSAANISLDKGTLGGTALARGTVSVAGGGAGHGCDGAPDKCLGGQDIDAPQPVENPFPEIKWPDAQSDWTAQGYTQVVTFSSATSTCGKPNGSSSSYAANWMNANMAADTAHSTILIVDCPGDPVIFANDMNNIKLGRDLLVISRAGFAMSNSVKFTSLGPDVDRNLYLIQPALWSGAAVTCNPTVGINLDNQVSFEEPVRVLLYSPCDIIKANNGRTAGQIYAKGSFTWNNFSSITYDPLPVWGLDASATSAETYDIEILYKRET